MTDRIDRLLNAGAEIQREVWGDVRFSHSLLCSVNLPYRNPTDAVRSYTRASGPVSLVLEAGKVFTPTGWVDVGLPEGLVADGNDALASKCRAAGFRTFEELLKAMDAMKRASDGKLLDPKGGG